MTRDSFKHVLLLNVAIFEIALFVKSNDEQCLHSQPAQISHDTGPWYRGQCQCEFSEGFNIAASSVLRGINARPQQQTVQW